MKKTISKTVTTEVDVDVDIEVDLGDFTIAELIGELDERSLTKMEKRWLIDIIGNTPATSHFRTLFGNDKLELFVKYAECFTVEQFEWFLKLRGAVM